MIGVFAFLWGLAEATVFFIIPDVILTYVAMTEKNKMKVLKVVMLTLCGALVGGTIVYIAAIYQPETMKYMLLLVPSVQPYMLEHVTNAMSDNLFIGLITGPIFGVPYKLFAFAAPQYMNLSVFLICSVPARLLRFVLVTVTAYYLSHHLCKQLKPLMKHLIWAIVWIIVYIIYFGIHGF